MLDHESRHADGRKNRTHIDFGYQWEHQRYGRWARGQAFLSGPGCADLFVPRHVRVEHVLVLARPPEGFHGGGGFRGSEAVATFAERIGVTLEHYERGGAPRMRRSEQG